MVLPNHFLSLLRGRVVADHFPFCFRFSLHAGSRQRARKGPSEAAGHNTERLSTVRAPLLATTAASGQAGFSSMLARLTYMSERLNSLRRTLLPIAKMLCNTTKLHVVGPAQISIG